MASGGRGGASSGGKQNNPTAGDNSGATTQGNEAAEIVVQAISLDSVRISQFYMMGLNENLRPAGSVSLSLAPTAQGGSLSSGWSGDYISSYVDDHRLASSFSELDRWESGFEELLATHRGDFSAQDIQGYRNGFASNRDMLTINTAIADMNSNQIVFAGIGAPALLAGGAVAAPLAAGYAGSFYVGGTASTIASGGAGFVTGGTFGAGFEYGKNSSFGLDNTAGGYTTAILGGGLGGTGLRLLPGTVLGRAISARAQAVALGGFSGLVGDGAGQLVTSGGDRSQINIGQLGLATGLGGGLGAVTPLEVRINGFSGGQNSSLSIYQGLNTKLNSGNIVQMRLRYPVNAGAANAVVGSGQQAVGTLIDGTKQRFGH